MSTRDSTLEYKPEAEMPGHLRKLLIVNDTSRASLQAYQEGLEIARRFGSEVVIARVLPINAGMNGNPAARAERNEAEEECAALSVALTKDGFTGKSLLRYGITGDTLFKLCGEEGVDLLLMGAYGHNSAERRTLGSTAEQLLRAVSCPVLTCGPRVSSSLFDASHTGPILFPIDLPWKTPELSKAIELAHLLDRSVEIVHVAEERNHRDLEEIEAECKQIAAGFRMHKVRATWSIFYADVVSVILARVNETSSPLLMMPLKRGGPLSRTSHIITELIQHSLVPVITYRTAS